ncbi:helix-turn-helix transcriptional regulator [Galbitalea sp. SE-J8]|uniref:helix-turn-helix transcriptional regulator n=1 Tax=Galbitalea sp. SE-J8 TaxID=3054952 RepID=UPI00259D1156|nr:helix-turn-helix transcriptional regulator [Galbitalea sp. SE-J8]MDM4763271.1 helix-turn-helix transcriptional regulator [Galbitalea sp. SE-J8]
MIPSRAAARDALAAVLAAEAESFTFAAGPSLSGRTTFLRDVIDPRSRRRVTVTAHPAEKQLPLSGLSALINALGHARLAEFAGRFAVIGSGPDAVMSAAVDLIRMLRGAHVDPTLVLIDDLDQLDDLTQEILACMSTRLTGTGLAVVATVLAPLERSRFEGARVLRLEPLDPTEAEQLLLSLAEPDTHPGTLWIVRSQSGGWPGVMRRALEQLSPDQLVGAAAMSLPPHVDTGRLALDDTRVRMLRRLSIAPLTAAGAFGPLADSERDAVDQLMSDRVIERLGPFLRICDPALRATVYWSMDATERRWMHTAAAERERPLPLGLAAWHDALGDPEGAHDAELLELALALAVALAETSCIPALVEIVERAVLTSRDRDRLVPGLLAVSGELARQGAFAVVLRYATMARTIAEDPAHLLSAVALEFVADAVLTRRPATGEVDVYVSRYRTTHPDQCGRLLLVVAAVLAADLDTLGAQARVLGARLLMRDRVPSETGMSTWIIRFVRGVDALPREVVPAAVSRPPSPETMAAMSAPALLMCACAMMYAEEYDAGRRALTALSMRLNATDPASPWRRWHLELAALNEYRAGAFADAAPLADELLADGARGTLRPLLTAASIGLATGGPDAVRDLVEQADELARFSGLPSARARAWSLRARSSLMSGDLGEAIVRLDRAHAVVPWARPAVLRFAPDHVEALSMTGDARRARTALADFERAHAAFPSRWGDLALLRARLFLIDDDGVEGAVDAAFRTVRRSTPTVEVAELHLAAARVLARAGRRTAEEHRAAAERLFDESSAFAWAAVARTALHGARSHRTGPDPLLATLTENELAVLRLIRRGVRNKDIAAALFVSLRTVEVRITQIYRKLDARSRSHLLALLPADGEGDESY